MSFSLLLLIIIVQIALFQFVSVAFTRSVFTVRLGSPPGPLSGEVDAYHGKATRHRFTLGGMLCLVALTTILGVPSDPGARKLLLAAVSLTSSIAFAAATVMDRRTLRSMSRTLADWGVRRASLEPRSIRRWYNPAWEGLPIAVLAVTLALTVLLEYRLEEMPAAVWVLQVLQAVWVIGALFYTCRYGAAVPNVSSRISVLRDRPELALRFGERLAAHQMTYFMWVKIGVTVLLGVKVVHVGLHALHHEAAPLFGTARWVIVGALLLVFGGYVWRLASITRRALQQAEQDRPE